MLKRVSSISARFQQELSQISSKQSESEPAENDPNKTSGSATNVDTEGAVKLTPVAENEQGKGSVSDEGGELTNEEDEAGDTDVAPSDDELEKQIQQAQQHQEDIEPPIRMSKRLMSLKRRGKAPEVFEKVEKFEYYVGDILTVLGEDTDFYVCRVLEDVVEDAEDFKIAWYDRIEDNVYKVSYDDTIYDASVLTHVTLVEREDGNYELTTKSVRATKRALRQIKKGEKASAEGKDQESEDEDMEGDDEEEQNDEEAPPVKKRRKGSASQGDVAKKTRSPRKAAIHKEPKERKKKVKEDKVVKRKGLLPNPFIEVSEKDPIFDLGKDIPLTPIKLALKAVLTNDMKLLDKAIEDVDNVYTIFWSRSPGIGIGPIEYALLNGNKEALNRMKEDKLPKQRKAQRPKVTLSKMDTGSYNFYTFGHPVRDLEASRGSREGNNAFLQNEGQTYTKPDIKFCLTKGISHEIIDEFCDKPSGFDSDNVVIEEIWRAVKNGHRKLAAHYIAIAVKREGHGFNFLHQEVLEFDDQPLSKFRPQSVTKKPYECKKILPIHCACINPNPKYAQALFNVLQEYNTADEETWKPVHYAAVCEGPGPLKFLLSRGVDPNDVTKTLLTPLILAAKHGRDDNIKELMSITFTEEEEGNPGVVKKRVNINAKSKKTLAAIHYAAKRGHESTVRLLVSEGAKIDLQVGSTRNNFTALAFAAEKGHLNVVKALCELKASPDKKLRQKKTALMHAAINGHYHVMSYLLNIGVNPNAADTSLNTPIHYAAAYGWYHCLQLLLEAGANPNCGNNWKTTPLAIALMKDHVPCADLLLSLDVDVDFRDDTGRTILMQEVLSDYSDKMVERVDYLVCKKGSNPNISDIKGFTVLHLLASHSVYRQIYRGRWIEGRQSERRGPMFVKSYSEVCCKVAKILLEAGADPNALNKEGKTPLTVAVLQNNFPLIKLLIEHGATASKGQDEDTNKTSLHHVLAKTEPLDLFEYYENEYDDPNGLGALEVHQAYTKLLERANKEVMEQLIKNGADTNAVDSYGKTPLIVAFSESCFYQVDMLLKHGANPLLGKNHLEQNLLHVMASKCSECDLSNYLHEINQKFDLKSWSKKDAVDNDGYTPFLVACETANGSKEDCAFAVKFVKVMIEELKVDIFAQVKAKTSVPYASHSSKDNYGITADEENKKQFKDYHMSGLFTCLHFLVLEYETKEKDVPGLKMMLEFTRRKEGFINSRDRHGRTPLHFAIHRGKEAHAKLIVNYGADLNLLSGNLVQDEKGSALYMSITKYYLLSTAAYLLEAEADPNVQSGHKKKSPLMHAITAHSDDTIKYDFVNLLLKNGADASSRDDEGKTALHYAASATSGGYETLTEVEDLLVKYKADVTAVDNFGRMPIHYAFMSLQGNFYENLADPISIINMLCEAAEEQGKDVATMVSAQDNAGTSVLHLAAMRGATMCCLTLIQKGASLSVRTNVGNYPLTLALRGKHHGCAMTCIQQGASAACDVYSPVTRGQLNEYKQKLKDQKWLFEGAKESLQEPKTRTESAFLVAVRNDWQGVAYLMLQMGGLPFIDAFKAALQANKLQLLWTILKKQRKVEPLFAVDEKKFGLLHILATYSMHCSGGVKDCNDVANLLISLGLSVKEVDCDGAIPLHYAAYNGDYNLCKILIDNAPETVNVRNKDGMNPAMAAFNAGIEKSKFNEKVIKLLMNSGTETLNHQFNTNCKMEDGTDEISTILHDLVLIKNVGNFEDKPPGSQNVPRIGCIEYFMSKEGNVDLKNGKGETPIMTAVYCNYIETVELLLKYKPDLSAQDKKGWSVVHGCVKSYSYGSYENVKILEILAAKKAPLDLKDADGHTPLYYANQQASGVMATKLKQLYKKYWKRELKDEEELMETEERGYSFTTSPKQHWQVTKIDPAGDASKELEGLKEIPELSGPPPVDKALHMDDTGEVYIDPTTNVPYDVVLTKVDVRWGTYGLNTFYKMQVIHQKGKNLWILFNRWGRFGDDGQHQRTPFNDPKDAVAEYMKIFKSKTGNDWKNLDRFEKQYKKYGLLQPEKNPERMLQHREEVIEDFNESETPKSKLPDSIKEFLEDFVDPKNVKTCVSRENQWDSDYLPFGLISRDVLVKAMEVLNEIESLLESLSGRDIKIDAEAPRIYSKIATLSNDYYMMVPPTHYRFERIRPLNRSGQCAEEKKRVRTLIELSHASQLLLAAQHNHKEINPFDYCYQALNVHVELMDPKSDETQLILEYAYRDKASPRTIVHGVYRVQRLGEDDTPRCNLGNKHLLWHGTHTSHMIGILKDGLQVDPPHAFRCGSRFGKGIYFSTSFKKSAQYCRYFFSIAGYVLLCEVSLGKIYYYNEDDDRDVDNAEEKRKERGDSIWVKARSIPDPEGERTTPYGAKVQAGAIIEDPEYTKAQQERSSRAYREFHYDNEVIVFDPSQVRIRYIVRIKNE